MILNFYPSDIDRHIDICDFMIHTSLGDYETKENCCIGILPKYDLSPKIFLIAYRPQITLG